MNACYVVSHEKKGKEGGGQREKEREREKGQERDKVRGGQKEKERESVQAHACARKSCRERESR